MVIIGFTGKMGSGKNYIAEQILLPFLTSHGYQVLTLAFADQLKIDCMTKYGLNYNDVFKDKSIQSVGVVIYAFIVLSRIHVCSEMGRIAPAQSYTEK